MASKGKRYPELQGIIRQYLTEAEMNVPQLSRVLFPISESRIYDWVEGRRTMDGAEYETWLSRTGRRIRAQYLRGEDRYGRVKKNREVPMTFGDMREIRNRSAA